METKVKKGLKKKQQINSDGITLNALVITIVVLLILAGITIMYVMGDNGVFKQALNAKEQSKIAQWQEKLETAKSSIIVEGQGTFNPEKYFEKIEYQGIIESKDGSVTDNEDDTYDVNTKPGYVFLVTLKPDKENPRDAEIKYIGQVGKIKPIIKNIEVSATSNSIIGKATVARLGNGTVKYYYKLTEGNSEYNEITNVNDEIGATQSIGIISGERYTIKVIAKNDVGEVEDTREITTEKISVKTITADDISKASNKEEYYGKYVDYIVGDNKLQENLTKENIRWRILYAGNEFSIDGTNRIYLIASDYVPYDCIPSSTKGTKPNKGTCERSAYFKDIVESGEYVGTNSITDKKIQNLNSTFYKYLEENNEASTYENIKAVAYMLDTNAWSSYKGSKAEYAIGAPTMELLFNSYQQVITDAKVKLRCITKSGMAVSYDNGVTYGYAVEGLNSYNSLYNITSTTQANACWIATPSAYTTKEGYYIFFGGNNNRISVVSYYDFNNWNPHVEGIRPVICLNEKVELEKINDDNFEIYQ